MDLEQDFIAWTDRRDPAALTRVFDATAGRLVLLAAHLCGGSGAEDLVQTTFLAAMTRAKTWDRQRPLWPWLAGILQNEARMHWRRQQRRRETDLEDAATASSETPDPQALAATDESFAVLRTAIDTLPLAYRQVLRLRLVHGLQPIEIAHALERPVGTVRAQLHRGLSQLRSALPTSLAALAAAWLAGDGALLAQVRAKVINEALATATAGASATATVALLTAGWWTGWWSMNGKTLTLTAIGAALLLLFALRFPWPTPQAPGNVPSATTSAKADDDAPAPGTVPPTDAPTRQAAVITATPAWPLQVAVRDSAGPVVGASVRVWTMPIGFARDTDVPQHERQQLADGVTGADGIYRCALDELQTRSALWRSTTLVFVEAITARGGHDRDVLGLPRTDAPQEFRSDLQVSAGSGIRGQVVDAAGAPVVGAEVFEVHRSFDDLTNAETMSDDAGAFVLAADPERWPDKITITHPTHGNATLPLSPQPANPSGGCDLGMIVLSSADVISGHVVLGDGSPLGDFPLFVRRIDAALAEDPSAIRRSFMGRQSRFEERQGKIVQVRVSARTATDGSFTCAGLDPGGTYAVGVVDAMHSDQSLTVLRVGETARLVVNMQLLLLDVRGEDGEALPGATVRGELYDPAGEHPAHKLRVGFPEVGLVCSGAFFTCDQQGRRQVLTPFDRLWCLYTTDEFAQPAILRHDVFAGVHRVERALVLRPALQFGALRLLVEDPDGAPMPDYGFVLQHLGRDVFVNHSRVIPPADHTYRDLPAGRWQLTMLLGRTLNEVFGWNTPSRGEQQREIVIEDGATTEVRIVSMPAGRVAFRLHAAQPPADGHWRDVEVRADAGGLEVPCTLHSDDQRVSPWPLASQFRLARAAFPPGRHGFIVTAAGYQPTHCDVEVVDGKLTQVKVELLAR